MNKEKKKWYLLGRWVEPVLSNSLWEEFGSEKLGLDFLGEVQVLNYNYLVPEADMQKIASFVKHKIDKENDWFEKYFLLCDKKVNAILYYKHHKNLSGFMSSLGKLLNHAMLVFFLDYGLLKIIENISEKTKIQAGEVLAQIKPFKKTPLMKYHEELRGIDKNNVEKFIKKYEWVGTHLFVGEPLNEKKLNKELADISERHEDRSVKILPDDYKYILEIGSRLAFYRSYIIETGDSLMYEYW